MRSFGKDRRRMTFISFCQPSEFGGELGELGRDEEEPGPKESGVDLVAFFGRIGTLVALGERIFTIASHRPNIGHQSSSFQCGPCLAPLFDSPPASTTISV